MNHRARSAATAADTGKDNLIVCAAGLALLIMTGCAKSAPPPPKAAAPVSVATVEQRDIPVEIHAIGNVEPYRAVQVRSVVNGQVEEVFFKEGQDVRQGQLLFKLDQKPFIADLNKAIALLHKDEAQAANSRTQVERYNALEKEGVISKQLGDQQRAQAEADAATVNSDKATVDAARVQLQYTEIRAPIEGRTGAVLINKGNLVKANDTPFLVELNQISPIYATFSVPESQLADVKQYAASRRKVMAYPKGQTQEHEEGALSFIDNAVDTQTGTVKLKALYDNKNRKLWPGEFVDVVLTLSVDKNAILLPTVAVQSGQKGQYVYVVDDSSTAQSRMVTVSRSYGTYSVVTSGVKPGERVIVDGQIRVAPNAKVDVRSAAAANPPLGQETPASAVGQ